MFVAHSLDVRFTVAVVVSLVYKQFNFGLYFLFADEDDGYVFDIPNRSKIRKTVNEFIARLEPQDNDPVANLNASSGSGPSVHVTDNATSSTSSSIAAVPSSSSNGLESLDTNKAMSVEQQLQLAITKSMDEPIGLASASKDSNTVLSMIKKEMSLFEGGGLRGKNIQTVYSYLLTIPPSSVEAERAFSSAGALCTRIRTRLSDGVLDDMLFLRNYFRSAQ